MRAVFEEVIAAAGTRPDNSAGRAAKKRYGELISMGLARSMASDLRQRGLAGILPCVEGGGERTFAGGIGAKRVDVSWAREHAGLLLALSLKTINFPDGSSGNYQKNLTNRRGEMLFEAVTLHRRFPFAVLGGFLFFHEGAMLDATENRSSTFETAHDRLRIFSGRDDVDGREEQYERIYIGLYSSESPFTVHLYEAGEPTHPVSWDTVCEHLLVEVAARNPDDYIYSAGRLDSI